MQVGTYIGSNRKTLALKNNARVDQGHRSDHEVVEVVEVVEIDIYQACINILLS